MMVRKTEEKVKMKMKKYRLKFYDLIQYYVNNFMSLSDYSYDINMFLFYYYYVVYINK